MGADAPASSAKPRKDEWAGEARASRSPSPVGGGVAAVGASGAPFSFFAVGANLLNRSNHQASSAKQETKNQGSSTYRSSPESSSGLLLNLKPESRLEGSTSEAEGASAVRPGVRADPRGINPVLPFFGTGGELPLPSTSSSSSSSLSERRRARGLRWRGGALDSPSVASESRPPSRSSSPSSPLESPEDTSTSPSGATTGMVPSPLKTGMDFTTCSQSSRRNRGEGAPSNLATSPPTRDWRTVARSSSPKATGLG